MSQESLNSALVANKLDFLLNENGPKSAMNSLSDFWPVIKGTDDINLITIIGEILNSNGYSDWATRWLLEKYLTHPTNDNIINLLVASSAELLDYELMRRYGCLLYTSPSPRD